MIGILESILCVIEQLASSVVSLLVDAANGAIIGLGFFLGAIFELLPNMPEPPSPPSSAVMQWLLFFVPLAPMVTVVLTLASMFGVYMGIRFLLTYFRAL